mgnify:CR=1 FL=1
MSGDYYAVKRAMKEVLEEKTIKVDLTEIESMKITDSAGNVINPATEDTLSGIKAQTDKLTFDDQNRVAVYDKYRGHVGGSFTVSPGSSAYAQVTDITAYKRVVVTIRITDQSGNGWCPATRIGVAFRSSETAYNAPYMHTWFAAIANFEFTGPTNKIKVTVVNKHHTNTIRVDYLFTWW